LSPSEISDIAEVLLQTYGLRLPVDGVKLQETVTDAIAGGGWTMQDWTMTDVRND